MEQRHTLYYRPELNGTPKKVDVFGTYKTAVKSGMKSFRHGQWFVDSERKDEKANRWSEFTPEPVTLKELAGGMDSYE
jgi:hypothetical protein